ncbi:MAG: DUF6261 family protein [Bacteroidia bacterium]
MLNNNPANQLRVAEFIQQGKDVLQILADANPTALLFKKQYDAQKLVFDEIDEVYKLSLSSPLTKTLFDLDSKRDDLFIGMCFIADGYAKSWDPAVKANAELIINSINVFGRSITVANYQSESADLKSLIDSWESNPSILAALTAMHLDTWKAELKSTNELFMKTFTDRAKADGETDALATIKQLRLKANTTWVKLENVLNGKIEEFEDDATKAPLYNALANILNAVFDKYNTLLSQRKGRKAAKDETPLVPPANN